MDGSGIGMSVAANKIRGIRAALVHDTVTARRAREHNHCNVLCFGTDLLGEDQIRQIAEIFLSTSPEKGRHLRRVEKLNLLEAEELAYASGELTRVHPTPIISSPISAQLGGPSNGAGTTV